ncbi:ABC transporter permease [Alkalisalibacterium limincola]|uniref:ABC transporter permease subunit n=1 Tax=Alkalisalibacterium limincola TaxID=2699169 RepID=A0A5C8KSC1_9GAMM|nr:ABC transporter permease [Alkalisalibacterium limincola]TXK62344.1 ABC transporter permease subunit [Alkalisalibacterium limincola]
MNDFSEAFSVALALLFGLDPVLWQIVSMSLRVAGTAVVVAAVIGLPLGAVLARYPFPGRGVIVSGCNALMGLPPVVAGLVVYLLLSRSGPLGQYGLLFTPTAMVVVQTLLVLPIVVALSRQVIAGLWQEYAELLTSLGAGPWRSLWALIVDARLGLVTVLLAGFGRAMAEVGAVMIVGGNIAGHTRTMTTAIALETSRGDLPLALGLGIVLLLLVLLVNLAATWLGERSRRALGERA